MSAWQQDADGHWVSAEPLPEPFGVRWERAIRYRRELGHGRLRATVAGWLDVRAIDKTARSAT